MKKNLWSPPLLFSSPWAPKPFAVAFGGKKVGNLCACVRAKEEKVDNTAANDEGGKKFRKVMGGRGEGCWLFVRRRREEKRGRKG